MYENFNRIQTTKYTKHYEQTHKLLLSQSSTRYTFLTSVGTRLENPQKNTLKKYKHQNANSESYNICVATHPNPTLATQWEKLKYQPLVEALEIASWYVILTVLRTCIQGGICIHNITNLFEKCYTPLMGIHASMHQLHLIAVTLLMLNNQKLENH